MADAAGWSTIESDEGVFTSLIENLGVKGAQFEELISLDADTIRSLSPVYGVIFLFKYLRETHAPTPSNPTTPQDGTYATTPEANTENLFFAAQTIQNACGTQAILSIILNQDSPLTNTSLSQSATKPIDIGDALRDFKEFTNGFPADLRGETLSNSEVIRSAHNAFARASPFVDETVRQNEDEEGGDVYHFIAYTPVNGMLYELDGLQPYPISHGACTSDTFPEKVIEVLQRRIARYPEGETRFNLMAVTRDRREVAREIGDGEMLAGEEQKRRGWAWENALRRSNFVGFIGEMVKGVIGHKERKGEVEGWIEGARRETQKKLQQQW